MNDASETLYRLKPGTYRYKKEIDVTQSLDYGPGGRGGCLDRSQLGRVW